MRVPIRKAGEFTNLQPDPNMTAAKLTELKSNLEKLKAVVRPRAAEEVKRLAAMGDFSENTAYQMAKGKLRGLNQKITDLEKLIARAVIIQPQHSTGLVGLGNSVTIAGGGQSKTYQILGSTETDPSQGIISYNSLLGSKLLGKKIGDLIQLPIAGKIVEYEITKIE